MAEAEPDHSESSTTWEITGFLAKLVVILILLALCCLGPVIAAFLVHPWLGALLVPASFWAWGRYGPPAFPGLLPGALYLTGFTAVLAAAVCCFFIVIRRFP